MIQNAAHILWSTFTTWNLLMFGILHSWRNFRYVNNDCQAHKYHVCIATLSINVYFLHSWNCWLSKLTICSASPLDVLSVHNFTIHVRRKSENDIQVHLRPRWCSKCKDTRRDIIPQNNIRLLDVLDDCHYTSLIRSRTRGSNLWQRNVQHEVFPFSSTIDQSFTFEHYRSLEVITFSSVVKCSRSVSDWLSISCNFRREMT